MNLFTVTHTHRHGIDVNLVRCEHIPSENEVVKALDLDFEPDREEYIDILHTSTEDVVTIP